MWEEVGEGVEKCGVRNKHLDLSPVSALDSLIFKILSQWVKTTNLSISI